MNVVEVKLDFEKQTFFFKSNNYNLKKNLTVVVNSDYGVCFGKIVNVIEDSSKFDDLNLYDVIRISTKKDFLKYKKNLADAKRALIKCRELVKEYRLNMNVIDAFYNLEGSQLFFKFVSDERIDFRELVKELGSIFKTRIELRQIGIRDKAKMVSGIGPCGRILCCSSFLNTFDSVTINMAKNQGVSLNPSKINGVCGRLLCCLKYENDNYTYLKKMLPKIGSFIDYNGENAKVIEVDVLKNKYVIELSNKNIVEIDVDEAKK